jgi:dodecin
LGKGGGGASPVRKEVDMVDSVYKIVELVGSSDVSWEDAAKNAIELAGKSLRDLRVAEITKLDMKVENGKVTAYRSRVKLSFKYASGA